MDDDDIESDKENAPPPKEGRTKGPSLTVNKLRTTKTSSLGSVKSRRVKKTEATVKNTAKQVESVATIQSSTPTTSPINDRILRARKSTENLHISNISKTNKTVQKGDEIKLVTRTTRSGTKTGTVNLLDNSLDSKALEAMNLELPVKRGRRGPKTMLEKMLELNRSLGLMLKNSEPQTNLTNLSFEERNNRRKKRCLRPVTSNSESDSKEPTGSLNESFKRTSINNKQTMADKMTGTSNKKSHKLADSKEIIEVITVKQEKRESDDILPNKSAQPARLSPLIWIPMDTLLHPISGNLKPQKEVTNASPPPGDEAEETVINNKNTTTVLDNTRALQSSICDTRKTMGTAETIIPKIQNEDSMETNAITSSVDATTNNLKRSVNSGRSFSGDTSQDDSFKTRDSKSVIFGKVSDLLSEEDKRAIESFYTVDMSKVNMKEVQKYLTIVDTNIRCNICGSLYTRVDKCQIHVWGHLKMKPYQCKVCDFSTVTVSNVRGHIRKRHLKIKPFACHLCEKRFVTAVLLEEHLNCHTGDRPYKCKLCNFCCANRPLLRYHVTSRHNSIKEFDCKVCGKKFFRRDKLRVHTLIHNKDKAFMCKICSTYLSTAAGLELHHKNVHMRDYVCDICGKHTTSRKALYNHRNVHSVAKYKCNLCPNVYKSSQILKEHLLKHKGIRKYECTVCAKSFAQQSHLAAHMAVHSDIRFHCPGCDRAFNRHDNMKMHTKRCKEFLANPELKKLLVRKERSLSNLMPYMKIKEGNSVEDAEGTHKTDPDSVDIKESTTNSGDMTKDEKKVVENTNHKSSDSDAIEDDMDISDDVVLLEHILRPENY